jgi:hypothetical protein
MDEFIAWDAGRPGVPSDGAVCGCVIPAGIKSNGRWTMVHDLQAGEEMAGTGE